MLIEDRPRRSWAAWKPWAIVGAGVDIATAGRQETWRSPGAWCGSISTGPT